MSLGVWHIPGDVQAMKLQSSSHADFTGHASQPHEHITNHILSSQIERAHKSVTQILLPVKI